MPSSERQARLELARRAQLKIWANDPVAYARERLKVVTWSKLEEILRSVRDNDETFVQSGNGVGKTFLAAVVTLWWMETRAPAKALTTGSSWQALEEALWPYMHTLIKKNDLFPGVRLNDMDLTLGDDCFAYARSPNNPEDVAGAHSPNLLQVVEEASGIDDKIGDALQGNAKGSGSRMLAMLNPLRPSGWAYRKAKSPRVKTIKISAFDHPNVIEGKEIIPGAVTRADIEKDAEDWCTPCAPHSDPKAIHLPWMGLQGWYIPSPIFVARVLGEFPEIDINALVDRMKLIAACQRVPTDTVPTVIGVDVARSMAGDETVIALGNRSGILNMVTRVGNDTIATTGLVLDLLKEHPTIRRIAVDDTGVGGGVTDALRANGIEVIAVNFAAEPTDNKEYFLNLKAQIYWEFKNKIEREEYSLPNDPKLIEQIEQFKPDWGMSGKHVKVKIEDKKEYKKRTGCSPDRAEACIIAAYCSNFDEDIFIPSEYTSDFVEYEDEEETRGMWR